MSSHPQVTYLSPTELPMDYFLQLARDAKYAAPRKIWDKSENDFISDINTILDKFIDVEDVCDLIDVLLGNFSDRFLIT